MLLSNVLLILFALSLVMKALFSKQSGVLKKRWGFSSQVSELRIVILDQIFCLYFIAAEDHISDWVSHFELASRKLRVKL